MSPTTKYTGGLSVTQACFLVFIKVNFCQHIYNDQHIYNINNYVM